MQPRQRASIARLEQLPYEIGRAREEDPAFLLRRFDAERDRQVGFPRADRAGEDEILGRRHPLAPRQRVHLGGVDAIGRREIKGVKRLDLREASLSEPLADH